MSKRRIGLLGGSFNPAHEGHTHISLQALARLKLDEVWWLVSPKNPLKSSTELAAYATRYASALAMAHHPRIRVMDIEQRHQLFYTIDTLRWLTRRHPNVRFVWLMGADNLAHFHRWKSWRAMAALVPIAILDRVPYAFAGLHERFATRFARRRHHAHQAGNLPNKRPPCWVYLTIPRHSLSASFLRKTLGHKAFLRHNAPK